MYLLSVQRVYIFARKISIEERMQCRHHRYVDRIVTSDYLRALFVGFCELLRRMFSVRVSYHRSPLWGEFPHADFLRLGCCEPACAGTGGTGLFASYQILSRRLRFGHGEPAHAWYPNHFRSARDRLAVCEDGVCYEVVDASSQRRGMRRWCRPSCEARQGREGDERGRRRCVATTSCASPGLQIQIARAPQIRSPPRRRRGTRRGGRRRSRRPLRGRRGAEGGLGQGANANGRRASTPHASRRHGRSARTSLLPAGWRTRY